MGEKNHEDNVVALRVHDAIRGGYIHVVSKRERKPPSIVWWWKGKKKKKNKKRLCWIIPL